MKSYILVLMLAVVCWASDPYFTLKVSRSASQHEIKSAYKKLAKIWHPDKNTADNAQGQMVIINEAYEILSNPERKEQYDTYGTTSPEEDQQRKSHNHFAHEFRRGPGGSFSFMFEDFPFGSNFHSHQYQKRNVLTRYNYNNIILPDSHHKIFLIGVFADFCFECLKLQPLWEKLHDTLESIGIGVYELNYDANPILAREIGVNTYPLFFGVIAGRLVRYKSNKISERYLREFLQTLLPHDLITHISNNHQDFFEKSFDDNKPQCLLFSRHVNPPLLFQAVAYEYSSKVRFAYVNVKDLQTKRLRELYRINIKEPSVVILKEEPSLPIAVIRGSALKRGKLREIVSSNLYFEVPRLSNQKIFDDLCPPMDLSRRWLCAVLITAKDTDFSSHLWKLRQMSRDKLYEQKRIRFFHLYYNIQKEFYDSFKSDEYKLPPCFDGKYPSQVLLLWRDTSGKVYYAWYLTGWCSDNDSLRGLDMFLHDYVRGEVEMTNQTTVPQLIDEHWHGHAWDFVKKGYATVQHIVDSIDHPSWFNVSSIGFILVVLFGITISCVIPLASELIGKDDTDENNRKEYTRLDDSTILGLQRLCKTTQKALLTEAPPGQMTIILLVEGTNVDEVTTSPITQAFSDAIFGYTGNTSYCFAWVPIAEQLMWCTEIMKVNKFGEVLPGTVLALNGFRKYLYIFRPDSEVKSNPQISADFIGFESSDDEGDGFTVLERNKIKKASIIIRRDLPQWLERLFDGTIKDKIRVESWPTLDT